MSFNFRDDAGVFGGNASIELGNGADAPLLVKQQIVEFIQYNVATTVPTTNNVIWTAPQAAGHAAGAFPLGTYQLTGISLRYSTASSSGTVMVEKTPSGTGSGAGTNLLTTAVSTSAAANIAYYGTLLTTLSNANATLSAGDSLSIIGGGTQTNLVNLAVTLQLVRVA